MKVRKYFFMAFNMRNFFNVSGLDVSFLIPNDDQQSVNLIKNVVLFYFDNIYWFNHISR